MNKLILGTVQFGLDYGINNSKGKPQKEKVFEILDCAYQSKISLLDTADAYGNAVDIIGDYHRETGQIFDIITKFKIDKSETINLTEKIGSSLLRLGIDSFWGYLYHSFDDYKKYPKVRKELIEARNNGKIKHIGVSIYNNEDLRLAAEDKKIDLIQLPYNLLDNDKQRGNLIAIAKANNKIVHTRSAFLQGLFFKDTNTFPKKLSPLISELENIKQLTEHHNLDMATLALKYATTNHNIDNVLIGVDSPEQLATNIQAVAANELSSELIHKIDSIAVSDIALLNPSNWS